MIRLPYDIVVGVVQKVLENRGCSSESAKIVAENCVSAQRDGSVSHGLFRLPEYISAIARGEVNGDPKPRVCDVASGFVRVDADNGFAQIGLEHARDLLVQKAKQNGIAILAIRKCHHFGALYLDVESFARQGLIALCVVNSRILVAPPGARRGIYGTNPMCFAAPRKDGPPIVFDQASSTIAHGDLQIAAMAGQKLPDGTGMDGQGRETCNPSDILDGGVLSTFGGYKGASIALMIEVLSAALTGADFSYELEAKSKSDISAARKGETIILIDPAAGAENLPEAATRIESLVTALKDAGQSRIPGERHNRTRDEAGRFVLVDKEQWIAIKQLALVP